MTSLWEKASTSAGRSLSDADRSSRQLSLRRISYKTHAHRSRLLAEIYYCAAPDSYDDPASDILVLCLDSNSGIRNAVENRILEVFDDDGDLRWEKRSSIEAQLLSLAREAISSLDRFFVIATRISVRTVVGNRVTFTVTEETELIFPFRDVPHTISASRPRIAQIASLKRLGPAGRFGISEGIDRVVWNGHEGIFAFKRAGRDYETTSHEIELLLQSPVHPNEAAETLRVSAVVTDTRGRLRGFLSPFEQFGSIEEIFTNRHQLASGLANLSNTGSVVFPRQPDWKDKLSWAAQLARAVATLHDGSAILIPLTLRNLNPRNVLVSGRGTATTSNSRNTRLVLAGFRGAASPTGMRYSKRWAAPERSRKSTYEIGPALDVANLGMVLWALAEERFDGFPDIYKQTQLTSPVTTASKHGTPVQVGRAELWQKSDPATPGWYRMLVESCLEEEPPRRPRAAEVAAALEKQFRVMRQ